MSVAISSDDTRIPDDRLAELAKVDDETGDIAAELLRRRRFHRAENRRSEQVRRLRWAAENLITKTEELLERVRDLSKVEVTIEHELVRREEVDRG